MTTEIVVTPTPEPEAVILETEAPPAEVIADASVEIAAIEADASVAITETHAAVEIERIQSQERVAAASSIENNELWQRMERLEGEFLTLQNSLTPPQLSVPEVVEIVEALTEPTPLEEAPAEVVPEVEPSEVMASEETRTEAPASEGEARKRRRIKI